MQTALSRTVCTAIFAALAFAGCSASSSTSNGPTILAVTPSVTDNADGTFTVDLIVDFDDTFDTGDLVDAYTFQTSDGQVDDVDVPLAHSSSSPFTIAGLILPADENGQASLGFHLALYGASTGLGSTFTGTINVHWRHLRTTGRVHKRLPTQVGKAYDWDRGRLEFYLCDR